MHAAFQARSRATKSVVRHAKPRDEASWLKCYTAGLALCVENAKDTVAGTCILDALKSSGFMAPDLPGTESLKYFEILKAIRAFEAFEEFKGSVAFQSFKISKTFKTAKALETFKEGMAFEFNDAFKEGMPFELSAVFKECKV